MRSGIATDKAYGAVAPSLVLSANFSFAGFGQKRTYDYTRSGNPTRDELAQALSALEGGAGAVVTAPGMAAITLVLHQLRPGDLLVVPHDGYGGTWRIVDALAKKGHFEVAFVDQRDPQALDAVLARRPRLVWCESPSNPLLRLCDLKSLAAACRRVGALLAVDNTFLSPALQNPLALGADLVVHSTTKYVNGHSDVVGGAVVAKDPALHQQLAWWANALGITGAPFDSWLTLRGLRTLAVRMRQHEANAHALAERLAAHPAVRAVHYPGLPTHPDHALARRQQRGFGGMLSFELQDPAAVPAFLDGLRCFTLAESLGGVESLVAHPATMTHASMTAEVRARAGITDGLLRLSVGIEAIEDLAADVDAALQRATAVRSEIVPNSLPAQAPGVVACAHQNPRPLAPPTP
ncbi:MAG: cystathionine gamma-synthase [Planctomycetes bacterium]|nr:cystathionine gamma-synthase [Planctomycetota bacterium]